MNSNNQYISVSAFAKSLGVDEKAVRRAIEAGHIVRGIVFFRGRKAIDPVVAREEWAESMDPKATRSATLEEALRGKPDGTGADLPKSTIQQAKEAKVVLEAKLLKLKYEQETGKLVEKRQIDMEIFAAGRYIRDRLMELPDAAIDEVLAAAEDRNAARVILKDRVEGVIHEIIKYLSKYEPD